ncbi:aldo/keto reductase [Streptomyces sp. AD2-2]|nr:aldo/keto reductase [Streptomyces sp. AD2-2]
MRARPLGRTSIQVGTPGFGAAPVGNVHRPVGDDQARATLDAAWDAGVRYYDTAPHWNPTRHPRDPT